MRNRIEFEKSLSPDIVGLAQAKRNRARYIKQLGETYYTYAGKISLYNMMKIKEMNKEKVRVRKNRGIGKKYFAGMRGEGTFATGNTPQEAREKFLARKAQFELLKGGTRDE